MCNIDADYSKVAKSSISKVLAIVYVDENKC